MLPLMAKKKPTQEGDVDRHKHAVLSLRPPPAIRAAVAQMARAERRSLAQAALILLEEALAARGLFPPAAGAD